MQKSPSAFGPKETLRGGDPSTNPVTSTLLTRRNIAKGALATTLMGAPLAAWLGIKSHREHVLEQDMERLRAMLENEEVSLSHQVIDGAGARHIILFVPLPSLKKEDETNRRLQRIQEVMKKGYGSSPTILLHTETGERNASSDILYELAADFAWSASRAFNIPYRSQRNEHADAMREFDAIAATAHERVTEHGTSIPAVVTYYCTQQAHDSPPDLLWVWNEERKKNGEWPLQGMTVNFVQRSHVHDVSVRDEQRRTLTER